MEFVRRQTSPGCSNTDQTAADDAVACVCVRVDVVMCLSTMVRNDTLQEVKDQRVSVKCRKQLRVEEVEMVGLLHLLH